MKNQEALQAVLAFPQGTMVDMDTLKIQEKDGHVLSVTYTYFIRGKLSHFQTKKKLRRFLTYSLRGAILEHESSTTPKLHLKKDAQDDLWVRLHIQFFSTQDSNIQALYAAEQKHILEKELKQSSLKKTSKIRI